jgi:hypothetical protein
MAVPNYTYLKLKMPSPKGVITVGTSFHRAYECEVECCELAAVTIASEELTAITVATVEETPNSKWPACSFEAIENTKEVPVDPTGFNGKVLRIGSDLSPKYESALIDFHRANSDVFTWKPSDMPVISREVTEPALRIKPGSKPVQQRLRRFNKEKRKAIGEEIAKFFAAGFIKEVYHPEWLANPVLIKRRARNGECVLTILVSIRRVLRIHFLYHA